MIVAKKGSSRRWMHEHLNDEYVKKSRSSFRKVSIIKPKASRPRSKEVYLLASQLK